MAKKRRGRPSGPTEEGEKTRQTLYLAALELLAERGFEGTTMRALAQRAGVSPGLAYRYFPSKGAIVMALYADLSGRFAQTPLPAGSWSDRVLVALRASLDLLRPHRRVLAGALQVLLFDRELGLFSEGGAAARSQVRSVFLRAVAEAEDRPRAASALGRISDVLQLGLILWMLIDRTPDQRATDALIDVIAGFATPLRLAVRLPGARGVVERLDRILQQGLYGDALPDGLVDPA